MSVIVLLLLSCTAHACVNDIEYMHVHVAYTDYTMYTHVHTVQCTVRISGLSTVYTCIWSCAVPLLLEYYGGPNGTKSHLGSLSPFFLASMFLYIK